MRCPQAPVPDLGQNVVHTAPAPTQPATSESPAVPPAALAHQVPPNVVVNGPDPAKVEDEDFADFQTGPTVTEAPAHSGMGI